MSLIDADTDHHKKLVFLAALLAPAALFLNAHSNRQNFAGPSQRMNLHLRELAARVLLKPLQALFKRDKDSATLLANLLGFKTTTKVDAELASRLEAAVCIATLQVKVIWRANY